MTPVSLTLPQFDHDADLIFDLCSKSADLGLNGVFVFDHLIPIENPTRPVLEAATTLGAVAAATPSPVGVGSLVLRVALRPPRVTAAIARTVSALVGSRATVGLGVGDRFSEEEARRFGLATPNLEERLILLVETISAIREDTDATRVWVGGSHPRLRRLAAHEADGWNAWGVSVSELAKMTDEVRAEAHRPLTVSWGGGIVLAADQARLDQELERRSGRRPLAGAELIFGTPGQVVEELAKRAELVDELVVSVLPNRPPTWDLFATRVLPNLG